MSAVQGSMEFARRARPGTRDAARLEELLLRIVDAGLAGCIFVVPLLMGGRQAVGQLALVVLAVMVALAWAFRQCLRPEATWRLSGASLLLLAGAALVLFQLIPLPEMLLRWIAPHTRDILPLWTSSGEPMARLGLWQQVSLTPAATQAALVLFLAYALLFLVTLERIRVVDDVERLLRWCAFSAVMMAVFGLVQLLTNNGKFFWFYEHPFSTTRFAAKGSFANRNHFAHFLALGVGPLIWWMHSKQRRRHSRESGQFGRSARGFFDTGTGTLLPAVALGIVLFAGLLSLSRAGALVIALAAAVSTAVCYRASRVGAKFVTGLVVAGLLIGASLTIFGYEQVSIRLSDLSAGSIEKLDQRDGRRTVWAAVVKAIPDYAVLGSGVGSHREVYPMYLRVQDRCIEYTHAENGYLQVALETGTTGFTLLLAGIGCCAFWCVGGLKIVTSARVLTCLGAVAASLAASVAHALVDFVWYVPACMAMIAVLAACGYRGYQLADDKRPERAGRITIGRPLGLGLAGVLMLLGAWMITSHFGPVLAEPHWHRYRVLARTSLHRQPYERPEQASDTLEEANRASVLAVGRLIGELEETLRWDPRHARAHLRLAECYSLLFEYKQETASNAMPLPMIRDAAIRSRFASRQALDQWMARAVGQHRTYLALASQHTRRGLALCPLEGAGYLHLAELCFLEAADPTPAKRAYIEQALKVRPFDGTVLFAAGNEAQRAGNIEQWLDFYQASFRSGRVHQRQLIEHLTRHAGREGIQQTVAFIIEAFQPDFQALRFLHKTCIGRARDDQLVLLRQRYAQAAESEAKSRQGRQAALIWLEAQSLYAELQDDRRSLRCARNAFKCSPNDYRVRYTLGQCLMDQKQYAEAESHFRWCTQRNPNDRKSEKKFRQALRKRLDQEGRTATGTNKLLR